MAYEELIQSMEMDAALRIREVQAAAKSCIDETLEAARRQADEVRAGHMAEAERRIEVERHQRLYRAREEVKAGLARVREEHLRNAVAAARESLACRSGQDGYQDVLEGLLREAVDVLLEASPRGVDLAEVRRHLLATPGVLDVHDLHAWTITSGMPVFSVHVVVADEALAEGGGSAVLARLCDCLDEHFDVEHCTFQLEPAGHAAREHASHP